MNPSRCIPWLIAFLAVAQGLFAQTESGELRFAVTDKAGLALPASITLSSEVNQYHRNVETDAEGHAIAKRLPFGLYRFEVSSAGFASFAGLVEIRSQSPRQVKAILEVAAVQTTVTVTEQETLVDPHRTGSVNRIGADTIEAAPSALPGRSLANLVVTEPGWVFEANGILHPRESEYQVQYVMDGIPLTDNRSAAFVADLDSKTSRDERDDSGLSGRIWAQAGRRGGS